MHRYSGPTDRTLPLQRAGRIDLGGTNVGHIVNMKEEPTMFMKTKDEEKSMLEEPTMSIKTNDLFWLSHDVDEK